MTYCASVVLDIAGIVMPKQAIHDMVSRCQVRSHESLSHTRLGKAAMQPGLDSSRPKEEPHTVLSLPEPSAMSDVSDGLSTDR